MTPPLATAWAMPAPEVLVANRLPPLPRRKARQGGGEVGENSWGALLVNGSSAHERALSGRQQSPCRFGPNHVSGQARPLLAGSSRMQSASSTLRTVRFLDMSKDRPQCAVWDEHEAGNRGALPEWMTDSVACSTMTLGRPWSPLRRFCGFGSCWMRRLWPNRIRPVPARRCRVDKPRIRGQPPRKACPTNPCGLGSVSTASGYSTC